MLNNLQMFKDFFGIVFFIIFKYLFINIYFVTFIINFLQ